MDRNTNISNPPSLFILDTSTNGIPANYYSIAFSDPLKGPVSNIPVSVQIECFIKDAFSKIKK
jgi:hypothetical protein